MLLQDKSVIITGAGPGMGSKLAIEAARAGAKVAIAARSEGFIQELAQEIIANGGQALAVATDITDQAACDRLAAATQEGFGRIDGLVNGAYRPGALEALESLDLDDLRASFQTTLFGAIQMTRAVLPAMKAQRAGAIVNIGTQVTRKHLPNQGGYAATKAALAAVNTTIHGWMLGKPVADYLKAQEAETGVPARQVLDTLANNMPLRRVPTDDECARAALLFLSDYTTAVTGASLDVNAGEYMAL